MNQPSSFGAHRGDQGPTPSFNHPARAVSAQAPRRAPLAGRPSPFAPELLPPRPIATDALTLARPCRSTATRMSWLGKLRQRRWPARAGLTAIALLFLGGTGADLPASLVGEITGETLRLADLRITDRVDAPYKNATAISATKTDTPLTVRPTAFVTTVLTLAGAYALAARAHDGWALTGKLLAHAIAKPLALVAFPVTALLGWVAMRAAAHRGRFTAACALASAWYLGLVTLFQ